MSASAMMLYFADGATKTSEETIGDQKVHLVWKVILRTGTWKLRPGPGGVKLKQPLTVFRDKAAKGHISMSEIKKNFDAGVVEYVTTPILHADGTLDNTGYVRKLAIQDVSGEDGSKDKQSLLWAGFEITEPDVAGKIERKTIPSVSAGVLFDYEHPETAVKYSQVLAHVMLTNKPWINKTGEFKKELPEGVMAAEADDLQVDDAFFDDAAPKPNDDPPDDSTKTGKVVWKPDDGFAWIKGKLQRALDDYRRSLMAAFGDNAYRVDYPYYSIDDVQGNGTVGKALVCSGYGPEKETWVAGYSFDDSGVAIDAFQNWTPARPEWVAASESPPSPASSAAPAPAHLSPAYESESELRRAQRRRRERLGLTSSRTTTEGGHRMGRLSDLLPPDVQLSDEQRAAIEAEDQESERIRKNYESMLAEKREGKTDAFLAELKDTPFDHPGTLKYLRDVFASDDDAPAIELSESTDNGRRTQPQAKTVTEIIEGFFATLPKDDKGKLTLSAQASRVPDDPKPPEDNPDDPSKPGKDKVTPQQSADALQAALSEQGLDLGLAASQNGGK